MNYDIKLERKRTERKKAMIGKVVISIYESLIYTKSEILNFQLLYFGKLLIEIVFHF